MQKVDFNLKIADTVVACSCKEEATLHYCRKYLTDEEPRYRADVTEAEEEDLLALYRAICEVLLEENVLLIHGSSLAIGSDATLFGALSGTGKSTHTRYWRELLGDRVTMVNDDKPLVKVTDTGALIYGTPWSGKHHLDTNAAFSLKNIVFLRRSKENSIEPCKDPFPLLLQQTYRPKDAVLMAKTLSLLDKLSGQVSFWSLACNKSVESAGLAYNRLYR